MLLRGRARTYADALPTPEDVLLLVEVADTSAEHDRTVKLPLYARHGIPEVWIVDLQAKRLDVYLTPTRESYSVIMQYQSGDSSSPTAIPTVAVRLSEILR